MQFVDDERPLSQLLTAGFWLPDFSKLGWDGSKSAAQNLETTARSDEFGSFVLGTGAALMERYRRFTIAVPRPGVPLPSLNLPTPDDVWRGTPYASGRPCHDGSRQVRWSRSEPPILPTSATRSR